MSSYPEMSGNMEDEDLEEVGPVVLDGESEEVYNADDVCYEDSSDEDTGMETTDRDAATAAEDTQDDASLVFKGHKDAVFCVSIDPKCEIAVTGGQDDVALVWNLKTGQKLFESTGFDDSVTNVGFSSDGKYLAVADMGGHIKVYKTDTWEMIWEFECTDIEWLEWNPFGHVLMVGTTVGAIYVWLIPSGEYKTLPGHHHSTSAGFFMPDGKRAAAGYADGAVKIWDVKTAACLQEVKGPSGHSAGITCMDCHHDNIRLLTGDGNGIAKITNSRNGNVLSTYNCVEETLTQGEDSEGADCLESVQFSQSQAIIATGTLNGFVYIWDIPSGVCKQTCHHKDGIVKMKFDESGLLLYTACLDGVIRLWDCRSGQEERSWKGHKIDILDFEISRDGTTLVSSSDDKTARVFTIHTPDR